MPKRRAGLALAIAAIAGLGLGGCEIFGYGAQFGYPLELPIPPGAVTEHAGEAWDNDDPMRARHQVIDAGEASADSVADFYREEFPAADGWEEWEAPAGQALCLVRRQDSDFTELVEVFPFAGSALEPRDGLYLVMASRLDWDDDDVCGAATSWIPSDLLR